MVLKLGHLSDCVGTPFSDVLGNSVMGWSQAQVGVIRGVTVLQLAIAFEFGDAGFEECCFSLVEALG